MARTRALVRRSGPVIVALPTPRRVSRRRSRSVVRGGGRRRSRGRGKSGGISSSLTIPIAIGGAGVGWLGAKGYLAKLPEIGGSRMTTLGLAGWAAMRFMRNKYVRAAGLSAVAIAAFDFGRVQGGGARLLGDEMISGDDVTGEVLGTDEY